MESSVEFRLEEWDEFSEIPLMHLSYLVQSLLPLRLIEWKEVKRHYESVTACLRKMTPGDYGESSIATGSVAEGYSIPYAMTRTSKPTIEISSDVDALFVAGKIKVSSKRLQEPNNTEYHGYFEDDGLQPGYTRICLPKIKQEDETFIFDKERGKYYLSSTILMKMLEPGFLQIPLAENETSVVHGPAFTLTDNRIVTPEIMFEENVGSSSDFVTALFCSPWPEIANSWKSRVSESKWLEPELVESIISDGCHVVAAPSKTAPKPDIEWRISFSASEGRLAREAVTDHQRQCYIYLKILRHQIMKNTESVLSSYVFKSVFLHCCEKLPLHYWKDYPGNCVLYMLDVLLECLERKHVPTYFLPENNLIAHLSQSELDAGIAVVVSLRIDPVTPILEYTDGRIIGLQSVIVPFREVIKPLLDDMKMFKEHRNKKKSLTDGIIGTGYNMCLNLLQEETVPHRQEAIRCLIDIYRLWLEPFGQDVPFLKFINRASLAIKDLKICCRFYEAIVSLSAEYPDFPLLRSNLACMYHSCAYTHPDGSEKRTELLNKAEQIFKQTYDDNKCSLIDYVTYLVKVKRYEDARHILEELLANGEGHVPNPIMYTVNELETLDDPLKQHVKDRGELAADDIAFAYFYLVKCLSALKHLSQITTVIEKFETHCKKVKTENATVLFQYAKSLAEI